MNVGIIGPGRVGTALARALPRAGHRIVAVTGRGDEALDRFTAAVAGVRAVDTAAAIAEHAELIVISTPDAAIEPTARELAAADVLATHHRVVHLAGVLGLDALRSCALAGAGTAAVHPAQTVAEGSSPEVFVGSAWAVTATEDSRGWAHDFVIDLGGDPQDLRDQDRVLYHAALVLGSNAVAAATSAARQLLLGARIEDPSAFLGPLAHRSVDNVLAEGAAAITGPVVRGDDQTIRDHLAALDADAPQLAAAYRLLQRAVLEQSRVRMDRGTADAVRAALDEH